MIYDDDIPKKIKEICTGNNAKGRMETKDGQCDYNMPPKVPLGGIKFKQCNQPGPKVIKLFPCSSQLSTNFNCS